MIMTLTLHLQTQTFQLVLFTSGTCQSLSSRNWLVQKPNIWYMYLYMHMFLQMSIGYLMIFACLVFPEPGRTTLPGTAQWPFPGIESSSGGQSKVEGASRCCAYWDWHRNPVLVVVLQEAIMKYFDDNQMHSKYEDFRDWIWIKRSTIRYASSCALTTLGYVCKIQCSCKQDIYQLQVDKVMQLYETMLTRFGDGYSWEFPTCSTVTSVIWFSHPKGVHVVKALHYDSGTNWWW